MNWNQHIDQIVISVSNRVTVGGGLTAVGGWAAEGTDSILSITGPEVLNACAIIGAVLAVLGFCTGLTFQILRHRREVREHKLRMARIQGSADL